eukprot:2113647-Rhodomonas_salina.2
MLGEVVVDRRLRVETVVLRRALHRAPKRSDHVVAPAEKSRGRREWQPCKPFAPARKHVAWGAAHDVSRGVSDRAVCGDGVGEGLNTRQPNCRRVRTWLDDTALAKGVRVIERVAQRVVHPLLT